MKTHAELITDIQAELGESSSSTIDLLDDLASAEGEIELDDKRWFDPRDVRMVDTSMTKTQSAIPYLIFCGHHCAIINVPRDLSSDGYGQLMEWFAKHTRGYSYSSMRKLHPANHSHGVWYTEELAGPDGAAFELFQLPTTPAHHVDAAERKIRHDSDVVRLRVIRFKTLHDIQADVDRIAAEDKLNRV